MNASAKKFMAYLDSQSLKYDFNDREDDVSVTIGMAAKNTTVKVTVFIDNDNSHVALRCFCIAKAPESKFGNVLVACNQCNVEYRWVKFVIDSDLDVSVYDDAIVSPETAGEELFELVLRMIGIVDDCYPTIMKSVWG